MKHTRIAATVLVAAAALTACQTTGGDKPIQAERAAVPAASTPSASATLPPPTPATHHLVAADLKPSVRVTQKQCFGSAGCNVTVKFILGWAGGTSPGKLDGTYDVTYRVLGDESGPVIGTTTVYPNGRYDSDDYGIDLSTPSSSTPIRVVIGRVVRS